MAENSQSLLIKPDFLSQDFCCELIAAFQKVSDAYGPADDYVRRWPYRTSIWGPTMRQRVENGLGERLSEIREKVVDEVCSFYQVAGPTYVDFTLFTEMMFGDCHPLHADNEVRDENGAWVPNHTSFHHCVGVLYLNDCGRDYEGGVVRIPSLKFEMAPQTGLLLGFLCGHDYQHEVTAIQSGRRYTIAIWITRDSEHAELWESQG
jgi:predicted 2-oxoglutarate/Fe(II)-dependent dioxygenase YbiX